MPLIDVDPLESQKAVAHRAAVLTVLALCLGLAYFVVLYLIAR